MTRRESWQVGRVEGLEHTLGLLENTLLNTAPQSLVEQRVEHGVGDAQVVVGLDILLERRAAA